jgi:hypothetical protein
MVYLRVAVVGDFRVAGEVTLTDDWDPMADIAPSAVANFCPFCSIATRWDVDVDAAKNFTHMESMAAVVAALEPVPVPAVDDPAVAAGLAVDGAVAGGGELELLEQAVIAAASARPSIGTMMARPASEENRMRFRLPRYASYLALKSEHAPGVRGRFPGR